MQKAGVKAFIYSFSVSLLAINVAGKAFLSSPLSKDSDLNVAGKSIALFVKKAQTSHNPSKKIYLSSLPEVEAQADKKNSEPEIIMASLDAEVDIPLEFVSNISDVSHEGKSGNGSPIVAEIVYSEENPLPEMSVEAPPVYEPERIVVADMSPPPSPVILLEEPVKDVSSVEVDDEGDIGSDLVRVPLQRGKTTLFAERVVKVGDPTEMNHVALNDGGVPIESMKKDAVATKGAEAKKTTDETWAQAESVGAKNQMVPNIQSDVVKSDTPEEEVKSVSDTVKNLIIPIPENVANTEVLTPRLAYPEGEADSKRESILEAINQKLLKTVGSDKNKMLTPASDKNGGQGVVSSLTSLFKGGKNNKKDLAISKAKARMSAKDDLSDQKSSLIIPKEIRLSFQPNKAEISGQTLKWIQAFALKAAKDADTVLEIRMDGSSSMVLQQKRLNMLYNILLNKGAEYSRINTVFTSREPNSFVLRVLRQGGNESFEGSQKMKVRNRRASRGGYIQW